ncbi:hypothetical protein DFH11DRAFT_1598450 [Phellopilus nigrolimitatus]|nr:hypothetical protein DFH11DRAFT_1598450 [Phellopilus nigrolimitatus]
MLQLGRNIQVLNISRYGLRATYPSLAQAGTKRFSHTPLHTIRTRETEHSRNGSHANPSLPSRKSYSTKIPRFSSSSFIPKLRRLPGLVLKVLGVFTLGYIGITAVRAWSAFHHPPLSLWPKELRKEMQKAWRAMATGNLEDNIEALTRAWEITKSIPDESLGPEPYFKRFSVAAWLADALERDKQTLKAYKILVDILTIYNSRSRKSPTSKKALAEPTPTYESTFRPIELAFEVHSPTLETHGMSDEDRHRALAVSLKLHTLAEKCDSTANGKWLDYAIGELMNTLDAGPISSSECFPDILSLLQDARYEIGDQFPSLKFLPGIHVDSAENKKARVDATASKNNLPTIEEVSKDLKGIPFPEWALLTKNMAVTVPLEQIAETLEKQGHLELAKKLYSLVVDIPIVRDYGNLALFQDAGFTMHCANQAVQIILKQMDACGLAYFALVFQGIRILDRAAQNVQALPGVLEILPLIDPHVLQSLILKDLRNGIKYRMHCGLIFEVRSFLAFSVTLSSLLLLCVFYLKQLILHPAIRHYQQSAEEAKSLGMHKEEQEALRALQRAKAKLHKGKEPDLEEFIKNIVDMEN